MLSFILSNWKTSLGGIAALMLMACEFLGVPVPAKEELLALILGLVGLASKDGNVSGGNVKQ
jgi:hypothetical protein